MPLFYSDTPPFSDSSNSNSQEDSSFLPTSNIYERVRSETPGNQMYIQNKIIKRLDELEKIVRKIYESNVNNRNSLVPSWSFFSDFDLGDTDINFENNTSTKLLLKIKIYLFYILILLLFISYKIYKTNL